MPVTIEDKLEMLNGCEVMSIKHEGCVYISKKEMKGYVCGESFDLKDSDINYLYKKMIKDELGDY